MNVQNVTVQCQPQRTDVALHSNERRTKSMSKMARKAYLSKTLEP